MGTYINVVIGHAVGESFTFTLHTTNAAGNLAGAAAAFHTAIGLLWNGVASPADSIKQLFNGTTGIDETVTTELDPLTGKNLGQIRNAEALVGTDAGASLPPQCATVVSCRTAKVTRAGRGRFFLPPMTVNKVDTGRILAAAVTQSVTASQKMIQSLNGAGYTAIVYHRKTRTSDNITSVDVGNVFDTQRRRRDKLIEVRTSLSV